MLRTLRKHRALRAYRRHLGTSLRQRFGADKHYRPEQVREVIRDKGYSLDFVCYALCMYCDAAAFDAYHAAAGEACDYAAMRAEIGARWFGGETAFDASTFDMPGAQGCAGGLFDSGGGFDGGGDCSDGGGGGD